MLGTPDFAEHRVRRYGPQDYVQDKASEVRNRIERVPAEDVHREHSGHGYGGERRNYWRILVWRRFRDGQQVDQKTGTGRNNGNANRRAEDFPVSTRGLAPEDCEGPDDEDNADPNGNGDPDDRVRGRLKHHRRVGVPNATAFSGERPPDKA